MTFSPISTGNHKTFVEEFFSGGTTFQDFHSLGASSDQFPHGIPQDLHHLSGLFSMA
jgi:hypothetical protein